MNNEFLLDDEFLNSLDELERDNNQAQNDRGFTKLKELNVNLTNLYDSEVILSKESSDLLKESLRKFDMIDNDLADTQEIVEFDLEVINKLINEPFFINYNSDNDQIVFEDATHEVVEYMKSIQEIEPAYSDEWISKRLPDIPFTTSYTRNRKMEKESRALYKLYVLIKILKPIYTTDFTFLLRNYNFEKLCINDEVDFKYRNFNEMLAKISSSSKLLGKYILSACNLKIAAQKKNVDPSFSSLLSIPEQTELENILIIRKQLSKKYKLLIDKEPLNWKKGELRYNCDQAINKLFKGLYDEKRYNAANANEKFYMEKCGKLAEIKLMNTECLSEGDIDKINSIVDKICRKQLNIDSKSLIPADKHDDYSLLTMKLKKGAIKLRLAQYKRNALQVVRECKPGGEINFTLKR